MSRGARLGARRVRRERPGSRQIAIALHLSQHPDCELPPTHDDWVLAEAIIRDREPSNPSSTTEEEA
jgi:hypothetical protein